MGWFHIGSSVIGDNGVTIGHFLVATMVGGSGLQVVL